MYHVVFRNITEVLTLALSRGHRLRVRRGLMSGITQR